MLTNFNLGTLFPGLLGIILLTYGIFYTRLENWGKHGFGKYFMFLAKTGFFVWLISFLAITATLLKNAAKEAPAGAEAVIVLGAGLNGNQVSQTLAFRLDKAITYYETSEVKPLIVVSGGQGPQELVTEAFAMKQYLLKKGIPEMSILEENQSHNTRQNFEYSKQLLDAHFAPHAYSIVYVTNGFHTFRSGLLAKKVGFQAEGAGAKAPPFMVTNYYFREYFSMIKYFVLDHFS